MSRSNGYNNGEPNPLHYYFGRDSAVYVITEGIRQGRLRHELIDFNHGLFERAKDEAAIKARSLDASTPQFGQDSFRHFFEGGKQRVVMLGEGLLLGPSAHLITVLPTELKPHELFINGYGAMTKDEHLTRTHTGDYLKEHATELVEQGLTEFVSERSRFFYFRTSDLSSKGLLLPNGEIDMARLVPLLAPRGYVGLEKAKPPSLEEYKRQAVPHFSSRLKKSLADKVMQRLGLRYGALKTEYYPDGTVKNDKRIADWGAGRLVFETLEEVVEAERFLRSHPKIGKSNIEHLTTENKYAHPTTSGVMLLKVVVRVSTQGYEPCVRSIQLVDINTYFNNELKKGEKTDHDEHEKRRVHMRQNERNAYYRKLLEDIFGHQEIVIPISAPPHEAMFLQPLSDNARQ